MKKNNGKIMEAFLATVKTPLLSGAGEGGKRADYSLARESGAEIPKVDGSVWKGSVEGTLKLSFGEQKNLKKSIAKLSFSDLKLLFFPVKSVNDVYILITCPICIRRFLDEMMCYQYLGEDCRTFFEEIGNYVAKDVIKSWNPDLKYDILGGCPYRIELFSEIYNPFEKLGMKELIKKTGVVSDEVFLNLVEWETEVVARNRTGGEAVFTEEYFPEGGVLYGFINEFTDLIKPVETPILEQIMKNFDKEEKTFLLQIGKNMTLGKGMILLQELEREKDI